MTYEKFLEVVLDLCLNDAITDYTNFYLHCDDDSNRTLNKRWIVGGEQNGSYDCDKLVPRPAEPEPEFSALNRLLLSLAPSLSFIQYQSIITLLYNDELEDYEYYGNTVKYMIKYIKLEDLYDLLILHKHINID
jgi:hypothetical protein